MSQFKAGVSKVGFSLASGEDVSARAQALLSAEFGTGLTLTADVFPPSGSGVTGMCDKFNVPYMTKLPLDPNLLACCENGEGFTEKYEGGGESGEAVAAIRKIADELIKKVSWWEGRSDDLTIDKLP